MQILAEISFLLRPPAAAGWFTGGLPQQVQVFHQVVVVSRRHQRQERGAGGTERTGYQDWRQGDAEVTLQYQMDPSGLSMVFIRFPPPPTGPNPAPLTLPPPLPQVIYPVLLQQRQPQ